MSELPKTLTFRLPEKLRTDFRVALMRQRVNVQTTLEAFVEAVVDFDNGEKSEFMKNIIKRSRTLSGRV